MDFLKELNIKDKNFGSCTGLEWNSTTNQGELNNLSPVDGKTIGSVYLASEADYENAVAKSKAASLEWRMVPAPQTRRHRAPGRRAPQKIQIRPGLPGVL